MQDQTYKKDLRADKIPEIFVVGSIEYGQDFILNSNNEGITCELSILCDKDAWKENSLNAQDKPKEVKFQNETQNLLASLKQKNIDNNESPAKDNSDFSILQFFDSHENFARYSR
jgi:hypothetical protein